MISAELTIIPIGTPSSSLSKYVAAAVAALDETGIKYQLSGMGTLLEAENPEELFDAIKIAHEAVFKEGMDRVVTSVKIDDRRDQDRTMEDKVRSVEEKLG
ncbi:MAG: MTH1187 family thiamine-binding protein [Methanobacteriaceae archaeon]|nr:MTH1187 family thiamine-binding protein [Methanobacteriaceae archaeon]